MPVLETKLNARSADFVANAAAMRALVDDLNVKVNQAALGGGDVAHRTNCPALCRPRRVSGNASTSLPARTAKLNNRVESSSGVIIGCLQKMRNGY